MEKYKVCFHLWKRTSKKGKTGGIKRKKKRKKKCESNENKGDQVGCGKMEKIDKIKRK